MTRTPNVAGPGRYVPQARAKSRVQIWEQLYGPHNVDEWEEDYLDHLIVGLVKALGLWSYHTYRSTKSEEGYPDRTIIGRREVMFAELKSATGTVSADQTDVIHRLNAAGRWCVSTGPRTGRRARSLTSWVRSLAARAGRWRRGRPGSTGAGA